MPREIIRRAEAVPATSMLALAIGAAFGAVAVGAGDRPARARPRHGEEGAPADARGRRADRAQAARARI